MSGKLESDTIEEAYHDRNLAVVALARASMLLGYRVGVLPTRQPPWYLLYIDLPTGQVSWHVPIGVAVEAGIPNYAGGWDGHDLDKKRQRLRRFAAGFEVRV